MGRGTFDLLWIASHILMLFFQYHCTQACGSIEQPEAKKWSWFHSVLWGTGVPSTTAEFSGPPVSENRSDVFSCKMFRARPSSAAWICMRWIRYAYAMPHWSEIIASLQSDRVYRTTGQNKAQLCLSSNMGERHTIPYAKMVHSEHSPNLRVVQRSSTVLYVSVQRKGPKPCPENMRMPSNEFC